MEGARFVVVLVKPKYPGNLGGVARVMVNFGFSELWLVAPQVSPQDPAARRYAMHSWHVLDAARTLPDFAAARRELDLAIGTASDLAANEKRDFLRIPVRLRELAPRVHELRGTIGLVFGPEDFGLTNEELEACDLLATIPAAPEHPSLNVSHAAAVVLYELSEARHPVKRPRAASRDEQDKMLEFVDRILDHLELPEHRKRTTRLSFQRMMGRAMMSKWEYHRLMGLFNGALRGLEELRREGKSVKSLRRVERAPRRPPASKGPAAGNRADPPREQSGFPGR